MCVRYFSRIEVIIANEANKTPWYIGRGALNREEIKMGRKTF